VGRDAAWDQVTGTVPSFDRRAIGAWIGGRTPNLPGGAFFEPGGFHACEHRWALAEAFRFHLGLGKATVAARTRALATRLKDGLAAIPRVRLVTPVRPSCRLGSSAWMSATGAPTRPPPSAARGSWPASPPTPIPTCGSAPASSPARPTSTPPSAPSTPSPEQPVYSPTIRHGRSDDAGAVLAMLDGAGCGVGAALLRHAHAEAAQRGAPPAGGLLGGRRRGAGALLRGRRCMATTRFAIGSWEGQVLELSLAGQRH
jgi:hypothetical protein